MTPSSAARSDGPATERALPLLPPTLIFCNTIDSARAVDYYLNENGFAGHVSSYHGLIPPRMRAQFFRSFVLGHKPLLVCTDVASRGLDTRGVAHVIQFDMANNAVDYLHRVGRTARIGKPGKTTALVTRHDHWLAEEIKKATNEDRPIKNIEQTMEDRQEEQNNDRQIRPPKALRHSPPLYSKLGVKPLHSSKSPAASPRSLKSLIKSRPVDDTRAPSDPRWERYKSPKQKLKETIESSLAKEERLWTERIASGKPLINKPMMKKRTKKTNEAARPKRKEKKEE